MPEITPSFIMFFVWAFATLLAVWSMLVAIRFALRTARNAENILPDEEYPRVAVIVPISVFLIFLLLFNTFNSVRSATLILANVPFAIIGGILALHMTAIPLSVSAAIGFIALFGISVMDGIIVLDDFNRRVASGVERTRAIIQTCETQMRPVVMTCIIACVGLLPAAVSTGIGSQVQKPLAMVVVGGMLFAPVLILVILPVLILTFSARKSLVNEQHSAEEFAGAD